MNWVICGARQAPVAPRAGAWIETGSGPCRAQGGPVAPRAGAWIETSGIPGEKPKVPVAPRAGAWIETPYGLGAAQAPVAPARGRDCNVAGSRRLGVGCRPPRGWRGLKPCETQLLKTPYVAPRAGAWIENGLLMPQECGSIQSPPRAGGD